MLYSNSALNTAGNWREEVSDNYPWEHPLLPWDSRDEQSTSVPEERDINGGREFMGLKLPAEYPVANYCLEMEAEKRRKAALDAAKSEEPVQMQAQSGRTGGGQGEQENSDKEGSDGEELYKVFHMKL
jgi:hypothetical protein